MVKEEPPWLSPDVPSGPAISAGPHHEPRKTCPMDHSELRELFADVLEELPRERHEDFLRQSGAWHAGGA